MDIIIHDMTIDEFAEYDHEGISYLIGTGRVDVMDEQPTIDAVPVVRCKDCKYYECHYCWRQMKTHLTRVSDMDFCSNGERRDSDETD